MTGFGARTLLTALIILAGADASAQRLKPTKADVRYGPYHRNLLDVYLAETKQPAPVLIHFHGGGWVGGDKGKYNARPYLNAGITVVSANYRYTKGSPDAAPYPAPMNDGARVVQFVRSKAAQWNIDPKRIALTGGSAGAVTSMWIAYRDDMAKPDSKDPVERQSTRVTCIYPIVGPTTLDPKLILKRVGGRPEIHPAILPFFDVGKIAELDAPDKQALIKDASPINHVTADDPPTFMFYFNEKGGTPLPATASFNLSIHHTEFGVMLQEKLNAAGVKNVLQHPGDGRAVDAGAKFVIEHLKPERAGAE